MESQKQMNFSIGFNTCQRVDFVSEGNSSLDVNL